jgi:excisionase family DNA binding protein
MLDHGGEHMDGEEAPLPLLVPVEEAARLLGIGRTATYGLIRSGRINSVKLGRRRLVSRASIHALAADTGSSD